MPAEYRDDLVDWFGQKLAPDPDLKKGQMMGHPGYACISNNKLFMMFYDDGILLKLPPDRYEEMLARDDTAPFMPMGMKKGMGTWVVWTRIEPEEYEAEWEIVLAAKNHVFAELPNKKKKKT